MCPIMHVCDVDMHIYLLCRLKEGKYDLTNLIDPI
jgi:hypothetical protein